jgi:hypothetical protein
MEGRAHSTHPWKGDSKCNCNKSHLSVVICYVKFQGYEWRSYGQELVWWLGTNRDFVFTNVHNGITTQIKCGMFHFFVPICCVTHMTNLVVKTLSSWSLMDNIEKLLVGLYSYLIQFSKKALELKRLSSWIWKVWRSIEMWKCCNFQCYLM